MMSRRLIVGVLAALLSSTAATAQQSAPNYSFTASITPFSRVNAIGALSSGVVVAVGECDTDSSGAFCLALKGRDGSFLGSQVLLFDSNRALANPWIFDLAIGADDRIVVAGTFDRPDNNNNRPFVARFLPTGSLDPSFGDGGIRPLVETRDLWVTRAVGTAVDDAGRILVAAVHGQDLTVFRLLPNGDLDSTFASNGISTVSFSDLGYLWLERVKAMRIDRAGRILVGVWLVGPPRGPGSDQSEDAGLVRFTPDGAVDTSFSGGGRQVIEDSALVGLELAPQDSANDRSFVAATYDTFNKGGVWSSTTHYYVRAFQGDGSADPSFGVQGVTSVDDAQIWMNSMAVQADGRVVVGGILDPNNPASFNVWHFAAARVDASGSGLDATFGVQGVASGYISNAQEVDYQDMVSRGGLAITGEGTIVIGGEQGDGTSRMAVLQIDAGGTAIPLARRYPNGKKPMHKVQHIRWHPKK